MTSKASISNKKTSPQVKYHHANTSDEHEVLIDDLFNRDKHKVSATEKAFDFTSINQYESIFKYGNNSLRRQNQYSLDTETKDLNGTEKYIQYFIIGFFYILLVVLLPFSLIVCLKKVKENESIVVYRLGRLKTPAYKPGYCILFPLIDEIKRHTTMPKEFFLPYLQIINYENAIFDISVRIRYNINDIVKMTNSLQDLNTSIKSIARGTLVTILSKKDASKIEMEKSYLTQDIKNAINDLIRKWGVEVIELEITINSIAKDESEEANSDPALRSISMVFKSLFNGGNSSDKPSKQGASSGEEKAPDSKTGGLDPNLFAILQGMTPFIVPPVEEEDAKNASSSTEKTLGGNLMNFFMPNSDVKETKVTQATENESEFSPFKLLKLIEPLLNENLVNEIQTVYEFHIRMESLNNDKNYQESRVDVFHMDLKNVPKGKIGRGSSLFGKADCVIKLNDADLAELLIDKLKPFTAYMSGRIEIEGDLQDVFKLKKLIKLVATITGIKKA